MSISDVTQELLRLDQARCAAISRGDFETLADLLSDDLTHTHVGGKTDSKESYLRSLAGRPRITTRGDDVQVRVYGDVAVMSGTQRNVMAPSEPSGVSLEMTVHVLQVWVKTGSGYKQVAFASSGRPAEAPQ